MSYPPGAHQASGWNQPHSNAQNGSSHENLGMQQQQQQYATNGQFAQHQQQLQSQQRQGGFPSGAAQQQAQQQFFMQAQGQGQGQAYMQPGHGAQFPRTFSPPQQQRADPSATMPTSMLNKYPSEFRTAGAPSGSVQVKGTAPSGGYSSSPPAFVHGGSGPYQQRAQPGSNQSDQRGGEMAQAYKPSFASPLGQLNTPGQGPDGPRPPSTSSPDGTQLRQVTPGLQQMYMPQFANANGFFQQMQNPLYYAQHFDASQGFGLPAFYNMRALTQPSVQLHDTFGGNRQLQQIGTHNSGVRPSAAGSHVFAVEDRSVYAPLGLTVRGTIKQRSTWTTEEDDLLLHHAQLCRAKRWAEVSRIIPGRNGKQCRERWTNHVDPELNRGEWTEDENQLVIEGYRVHSTSWSKIAAMLKNRAPNAVKNHFNTRLFAEYQRKYAKKDGHPLPLNPPSDSEESEYDVQNGQAHGQHTQQASALPSTVSASQEIANGVAKPTPPASSSSASDAKDPAAAEQPISRSSSLPPEASSDVGGDSPVETPAEVTGASPGPPVAAVTSSSSSASVTTTVTSNTADSSTGLLPLPTSAATTAEDAAQPAAVNGDRPAWSNGKHFKKHSPPSTSHDADAHARGAKRLRTDSPTDSEKAPQPAEPLKSER